MTVDEPIIIIDPTDPGQLKMTSQTVTQPAQPSPVLTRTARRTSPVSQWPNDSDPARRYWTDWTDGRGGPDGQCGKVIDPISIIDNDPLTVLTQ